MPLKLAVYDVSSIVSKNRNVSDGELFPYGKSNFGAYIEASSIWQD